MARTTNNADKYQRDNCAIARMILAHPERECAGLVEWANAILQKETRPQETSSILPLFQGVSWNRY